MSFDYKPKPDQVQRWVLHRARAQMHGKQVIADSYTEVMRGYDLLDENGLLKEEYDLAVSIRDTQEETA